MNIEDKIKILAEKLPELCSKSFVRLVSGDLSHIGNYIAFLLQEV